MEKTREIEQYLRWKFRLRVLEFAKDYGKVKGRELRSNVATWLRPQAFKIRPNLSIKGFSRMWQSLKK